MTHSKAFFIGFVFLLTAHSATATDVKKLEQDFRSVNASIELTKKKIKGAQEIQFLPDLYFMLGELLVDKARLAYAIKKEKNASVPSEELDFVAEKQIRLEAIEAYRLIEERYPRFTSLDKVLFTQALEYLQLNDVDQALRAFKKITERFSQSSYYSKSLLEIGNIFFEKKDYEFALEQYQKIISLGGADLRKENAYYKAAWCYIYKGDFLKAMIAFDKVFVLTKNVKIEANEDIREEALIASVWPISEMNAETAKDFKIFLDPINYYRSVAYDKSVFRRVLSRLAKRMAIKERPRDSYLAFLELFRLSDDLKEKIDAMEQFYLKGKEIKISYYPSWVSDEVAKTLWLTKQDDVEKASNKKELMKYEAFYRDFTTTLHKYAMSIKRHEDLQDVIRAYEKYLWIYPKTAYMSDIYLNMAEAAYHAQDFIKAGSYYAKSSELTKVKAKRREYLDSAISSYTQGFSNLDKLNSLEKIQGRSSFQRLATQFKKEFPGDSSIPMIQFNFAKSFYDEQNFLKAAEQFKVFIKFFPKNELTEQAAILLVDSYYIRDDLQGVVREAKDLQGNSQLHADLRKKMIQIMQQAQLKKVRSIAGDIGSKGYADKFLELAKSSKGSSLSEPALYEAFAAMKAANDVRVFEIGEQYISQYGTNPRSKEILLSIAQKALISADYRRAMGYLMAFSQRFKAESSAQESLIQATVLADHLGDSREAAQGYLLQGDVRKAAGIYNRYHSWNELSKLATSIPGPSGLYYQGLALYRQGDRQQGLSLLRRAADSTAMNDEEKMHMAHAGIILIEDELGNFVQIGKGGAFSTTILQNKIQSYQTIDKDVQKVIASGAGKWVIAGLMNAGVANAQFAHYLKSSQAPAGINPAQFKSMVDPQIISYANTAKDTFLKCLATAEEFEVFTKYVEGCKSQGGIVVTEAMDNLPPRKASERTSSEWLKIRAELIKSPRSIPLLRKAMLVSLREQDYSYAQVIVQRMIDIAPQASQNYSDLGVCQLFMNDFERAQSSLTEALKKDPNNASALWALAGLYHRYSFNRKKSTFLARAKNAGRAQEPLHPLMKASEAR